MSDQPEDGERAPKNDSIISQNTEPTISTAGGEPKSWPPEEKEHKAAERRHWVHQEWSNKITLGISMIAVIGAIVTTIVSLRSINAAIEAASQARRQADAAFAEQRPWLRIELSLVGLRFIDNGDADISFAVHVKNVGRSPARNIQSRIQGAVTTKDDAINSIPNQKRQCDLARKDADEAKWSGAFLFPDESDVPVMGLSGGRAIVTHDTYPTAWPKSDYFVLQIIGCFDYTLPSGDHGQTGFTYRLSKNLRNRPAGGFSPKPGNVNLSEVLFQQDPFSRGYFQ